MLVNSPNDQPGRKKRREERTTKGWREMRGFKCRKREGEEIERSQEESPPKTNMSSEENTWIIEKRLVCFDVGKM